MEDVASSAAVSAPLPRACRSLRDPEFYHRLMSECSKEEAAAAAGGINRVGDYQPPQFVKKYLAANDVRPLKKVSTRTFMQGGGRGGISPNSRTWDEFCN